MIDENLFNKAFKIIRRNYGCPGIDGLSVRDIKSNYKLHLSKVTHKFLENSINTLPIKRSTIIDYANKPRNIYVYCLYERWIQQYLKLCVEPTVEKTIGDCVFGNRRGLSINNLNSYIKNFNTGLILHVDISRFYDNINNSLLLDILKNRLGIPNETLNKIRLSVIYTGGGLPQGNALSTTLSNVYLFDIDNLFTSKYARYSDDMFFAVNNQTEQSEIITKLQEQLKKLNLSINFNKVEIKDAKNFG